MKHAPRLEINLDKIHHNARTLIQRLDCRGISITGITKATLGYATYCEDLIASWHKYSGGFSN